MSQSESLTIERGTARSWLEPAGIMREGGGGGREERKREQMALESRLRISSVSQCGSLGYSSRGAIRRVPGFPARCFDPSPLLLLFYPSRLLSLALPLTPAPAPIPHDFVHNFRPQLSSPRARHSFLHIWQSTDTENAHVVGQERPSASSSACMRRADKYPWCPFSIQLKCSASLPAPPSAHARSHLVPSRNPPAAPHAIRETIISLHHRISSYSRSQSLIPLLLTASPLPTARSFRYRRTLPSSQAAPLAVSFWTHVCRH